MFDLLQQLFLFANEFHDLRSQLCFYTDQLLLLLHEYSVFALTGKVSSGILSVSICFKQLKPIHLIGIWSCSPFRFAFSQRIAGQFIQFFHCCLLLDNTEVEDCVTANSPVERNPFRKFSRISFIGCIILINSLKLDAWTHPVLNVRSLCNRSHQFYMNSLKNLNTTFSYEKTKLHRYAETYCFRLPYST